MNIEDDGDKMASLVQAPGRARIELAPHPTDPARLRHRPADLAPDLADGLRRHRGTVLGLLGGTNSPASSPCPPGPPTTQTRGIRPPSDWEKAA
jgi:hypothetical protein